MAQQIDGYTRHSVNELLHYLKATYENPKDPDKNFRGVIRRSIEGSEKWCPFTHKGLKLAMNCYQINPDVNALLAFLEKFTLCARFLVPNRYYVDEMDKHVSLLRNPEEVK